MKSLTFLVGATLILAPLIASGQGQANPQTTIHFAQDGLIFDYPEGWTVTNSSSADTQKVTISRSGSSARVMIVRQRALLSQSDFEEARRKIADPLVAEVGKELGAGASKGTPVSLQIAGVETNGIKIRGSINRKPASAEIYSFRLALCFTNLVYVRADAEEGAVSGAWQTLLRTLKQPAPLIIVGTLNGKTKESGEKITRDVQNGRVLSLPQPEYPPLARAAHASGAVDVQVLIDEHGNVVWAQALLGHPLLRPAAVAAARAAKFSPTVWDGEPVRVMGVITYNFVAR
jgi:TonB family protein